MLTMSQESWKKLPIDHLVDRFGALLWLCNTREYLLYLCLCPSLSTCQFPPFQVHILPQTSNWVENRRFEACLMERVCVIGVYEKCPLWLIIWCLRGDFREVVKDYLQYGMKINGLVVALFINVIQLLPPLPVNSKLEIPFRGPTTIHPPSNSFHKPP